MVIALFYTSEVYWGVLGVGAVFLVALVAANRGGVGKPLPYALWGSGCGFVSGIGRTRDIAGVLMANDCPASSFIEHWVFLKRSRGLLDRFEQAGERGGDPCCVTKNARGPCTPQ